MRINYILLTSVSKRRHGICKPRCSNPPTLSNKHFARNNILAETIEKMVTGIEFYADEVEEIDMKSIATVQCIIILSTLLYLVFIDHVNMDRTNE